MNKGVRGGWRKASTDLRVIRAVLDGGGSALTTGAKKAYVSVPFPCEVVRWRVFADQSGSVQVDVWRSTYDTFPPVVAGTIAGTDKPALVTAQKAESTALTGWQPRLDFGDVLEFNVDSITTVTKVYVDLFVKLLATIPSS